MSFWTNLADPPREFGVFPFWSWNDDLDAAKLRRQIADFAAHGVYGFVIHPRVGLPRTLGWMSGERRPFDATAPITWNGYELRVLIL